MTSPNSGKKWSTLDRDLNRISHLESATLYVSRPMVGFGIAIAFIVIAGVAAGGQWQTLDGNVSICGAIRRVQSGQG